MEFENLYYTIVQFLWYKLVTFLKFEFVFDAEKTPILQISERENRILGQLAASNNSRNVIMNFNQNYTKITNFVMNILEVQARGDVADS